MLVVTAGGQPGRSERQLRDTVADLPGLLILNALVRSGENGRVREIDGVVFTPTDIYTVEVKGTAMRGNTATSTNAAWTIGGKKADFAGGTNPLRQARAGAQTLASACRDAGIDPGFITPVLAVAGDHVTVEVELLGDVHVTGLRDLTQVLTSSSRPRPLSPAQVVAVCALLEVEVSPEQLAEHGFCEVSRAEARAERNTWLRNRAADALREALTPLPGIVVPSPPGHADDGSDHRVLLLTPAGLFAVRTLATNLRGAVDTSRTPWTVGDRTVTLGRGRPERPPARTASAIEHKLAAAGISVAVTPIVSLTGVDLEVEPHETTRAWVCRTEDIAAVMLRAHQPLDMPTAAQVAAALGHPVTDQQLRAAGFARNASNPSGAASSAAAPSPPRRTRTRTRGGAASAAAATPSSSASPASAAAQSRSTGSAVDAPVTSRQQRRAERLAQTRAQAHEQWRSQNNRRVVGSAAAGLFLLGTSALLPPITLLHGVLFGTVFGAWQLTLRRRMTGPRDRGPVAALLWVITLVPLAFTGTVLSLLGAVSEIPETEQPLLLLMIVLSSLLLGAILLLGRSSFIYPPPVVMERHDAQGRATGTYTLVSVRLASPPKRFGDELPGDWRPRAD